MSDARAYFSGEDRSLEHRNDIVCQAGGQGGRYRICNGATIKTGRVQISGHWADQYECQKASHRFVIWGEGQRRRVMDVPKAPPEFGHP